MNRFKNRLAILLAAILLAGSLQGPVFAAQSGRGGTAAESFAAGGVSSARSSTKTGDGAPARETAFSKAGAAAGASAEKGTLDPAQVTETEPLDLEPEGGTPVDPPEEEYYIVTVQMDGGYGGIYHGSVYDDSLGESVTDPVSFVKKVKKGEAVEFMPGSLYIGGEQPHDFLGWSLSPDGEILEDRTSYTPEGDCTLYANWTSHAAFVLMDGDHFPDGSYGKTVYADRDGWVTLPEDPVTDTYGWKFYRWIWASDGSPVEIIDGKFHIDYTCTVNPDWRDIKVEEIVLDRTALSLGIGETAQITVTSILPENALTKEITWKSSDDVTAAVDENGVVTGVRRGTAVITAYVADGGGAKAECTVDVDGGTVLVTFDANGGAFSGRFWDAAAQGYVEDPVSFSRQDLGYGAAFSSNETILHSDPSMRFRGWSLAADGEPVYGKTQNVRTDTDITLYAVWEPVYVVSIDMNGGNYLALVHDDALGQDVTSPASFVWEIKKGEALTFEESRIYYSSDPDRAFIGWSLSPDGEILEEKTSFTPAADCTLYANWTKAALFVPQGGSFEDGSASIRIMADENGLVAVPAQVPVCEDENKVFGGWTMTEGGEPAGPDEEGRIQITQDSTFVPVWKDRDPDQPEDPEEGTWTVRIDFHGGYLPATRFDDETQQYVQCPESYVRKVKKGEKLGEYLSDARIADPHRALAGWSLAPDGEIVASALSPHTFVPTADCTFYAVWGDAYSVTLDLEGEGYFNRSVWDDENRAYLQNPEKVTVKALYGKHADLYATYATPNDPSLKLSGWSLEKNGANVTPDKYFYTPEQDCTLYPLWAKSYTVTIDLNGAAGAQSAHYSGNLWDSLAGGSVSDPEVLHVTVADGESFSLNRGRIVQEDPSLALFGWSLEPGGEVILDRYASVYKPESDCTLYAVWDTFYKVTVDFDGGWNAGAVYDDELEKTVTDAASYVKIVRRGEALPLYPNSAWYLGENQHDFKGWSLEKNGAVFADDTSFTPSGDCTVYAVWTSHAVFYALGGHFPNGDLTIRADADENGLVTVPEEIPLCDDGTKIFDGWYLPSTGEKIAVDENGKTAIAYNCTFNPVWKDKPQEDPDETFWTVIFDANGGTFPDGQTQITREVEKGKAAFFGREPVTEEDKVFGGWTTADGTLIEDAFYYIPAGNETLFAVWADYYTVTFDGAGGELNYSGNYRVNKVAEGSRFYFGHLKAGYTDNSRIFLGWAEEGKEGLLEDQRYYTPEQDVTLVAEWADAAELTFDAGEGYFRIAYAKEIIETDEQGDPYVVDYYTAYRNLDSLSFLFPAGFTVFDAVLKKYNTDPCFDDWIGEDSFNAWYEEVWDDDGAEGRLEARLSCQTPKADDETLRFIGWSLSDGTFIKDGAVKDFIPEGDVTFTAVWHRDADSITLDRTSLTLNTGETGVVTATVGPENATERTVLWSSDDPAVATVNADGEVTAVGKGTATITAAAKDDSTITASCTVTVKQPVTELTLNRTALTLNRNRTFALTAAAVPSNADNKAVTWKSSNTKVATVDTTGTVTAVAKGTATITATAKDGSGVIASCRVTVKQPVTRVTMSRTALTLNKGKKETLTVTVLPASANNKAVTWTSSNKAVAAVTQKGVVRALKKGTATITATAKDGSGKKAVCKVTVKQPVTSLKINKTTLTVKKGQTAALKVTVSPSTANNKTLKWTTSNKAVAAVTQKGVVRALKKGTATITATAKDGSGKKAVCKVTVKQPVTSLKINKTTLTVKKGQTAALKVTVSPSTANNKTLKWTTSNKAVATVTTKGVVKGIKKGTATITAAAADGSGKKVTCKVTVK